MNSFNYNGLKIEWLNHHASFKITGSRTIIIDPWECKPEKADILIVTHPHYDHFNKEDVENVLRKNNETVFFTVMECVQVFAQAQEVLPGDVRSTHGVEIKFIPAYNTNKEFHPKEKKWIGAVIKIDGVSIYNAGDCDVMPEMKGLGKIDIALLPAGGTYTMNGEEAAEAAGILKPKIAVPMHWGKIVGTREDAETFAKKAPCETKILE